MSIGMPVLDKEEELDQHFNKLLEEQYEVNHEILIMLITEKDNREKIIEEALDSIQVKIGLLDYFKVTKKDIEKHMDKLKSRGWKFKKILKIEEE